jgi:Cullin family
LREEESRIERYLTWDSIKERLLSTFKEEMLYKHQSSLLDRETGIRYLLQHEKFDDLAVLFQLYFSPDKEQYIQPIAQAFREFVQEKGKELVGRVDFNQEEHKEHTKVKEVL